MNKDLLYWFGYVLTIIISILLTPIYFVCILFLRGIVFIWELLYDTITLMPKASYEYTQARLKRYWEEEMKRINKKFKDD